VISQEMNPFHRTIFYLMFTWWPFAIIIIIIIIELKEEEKKE
jgi:hypothetical protein